MPDYIFKLDDLDAIGNLANDRIRADIEATVPAKRLPFVQIPTLSLGQVRAVLQAAIEIGVVQPTAQPQAGGVEPNDKGLLPCPFCGHKDNEVTGAPGMYEILCDGCDHASFAYFHTEWLAKNAWNKRVVLRPGLPSAGSEDA